MDIDEILVAGKLSDNLMLSGGAKGADTLWGEVAKSQGHQVIHWSFDGHNTKANSNFVIKLDEETLITADEFLIEANKTLKRHLNFHKKWLINLLRRNLFQVQYAEQVYAVGTLSNSVNKIDSIEEYEAFNYDFVNAPRNYQDTLGISGGTAWACQMYLDRHEKNNSNQMELYFFDQATNLFYQYDMRLKAWYQSLPCRPSGIYAAIGSRNLTSGGEEFIKTIFK